GPAQRRERQLLLAHHALGDALLHHDPAARRPPDPRPLLDPDRRRELLGLELRLSSGTRAHPARGRGHARRRGRSLQVHPRRLSAARQQGQRLSDRPRGAEGRQDLQRRRRLRDPGRLAAGEHGTGLRPHQGEPRFHRQRDHHGAPPLDARGEGPGGERRHAARRRSGAPQGALGLGGAAAGSGVQGCRQRGAHHASRRGPDDGVGLFAAMSSRERHRATLASRGPRCGDPSSPPLEYGSPPPRGRQHHTVTTRDRLMAELKLKTVTLSQGNNRALKDGTVKPRTFAFEFEEVDPLIAGFRRMVRGNEFDICEMAITTYICAKAHGKRMTAVPVFLVRAFHHGAILVNAKAGSRSPKDLEGRKIGVNRGYTVTTGVWARSILQDEHGVDLSKVTWVLSGDEPVAEYRAPANVVPIEKGKAMGDMLASGELAAAIGVEANAPDVKPLIPNALEAGLAALRQRGHYPINHLVVIKDEL